MGVVIGDKSYTFKISDIQAVLNVFGQSGYNMATLSTALNDLVYIDHYDQDAALLKLFGNAITLTEGPKATPNASQPVQTYGTEKHIQTINCP